MCWSRCDWITTHVRTYIYSDLLYTCPLGPGSYVYVTPTYATCAAQDSGSVRWTWSCPKPVFASPSLLANHSIAIGSVDGECYVLSPQGELVRRGPLSCWVDTSSHILLACSAYSNSGWICANRQTNFLFSLCCQLRVRVSTDTHIHTHTHTHMHNTHTRTHMHSYTHTQHVHHLLIM